MKVEVETAVVVQSRHSLLLSASGTGSCVV